MVTTRTRPRNKSYYFYVLFCKDTSFYGGFTTNLSRREWEHNQGIGAKYTRMANKRPVKMIYAECFTTRSQATKAEYAFKKLKRNQKVTYLKRAGVKFPLDLNRPCLTVEGEKRRC